MGAINCCTHKSTIGDEDEHLINRKANTYIGKRNFVKERHGYGIFYYENGDIYEGEWKNDKKEGYGTYKHNNGKVISGYFKRDDYIGPAVNDNKINKEPRKSLSPAKDDGLNKFKVKNGYGATSNAPPRKLFDPRNSLEGLTADELTQKQKEDEIAREKAQAVRQSHRQSVDIMRAKYNIPEKKRNSVRT